MEEKELDEQIKEEVNSNNVDMENSDSGIPDSEASDSESPDTGESAEAEAVKSVQDEEAGSGDKKEKKKSFLGRDKKEKANKLQEKVDELEDRVKRQMAEFDNFRKRSEKEKSAMFETGAKSVVEKILPVVDNFERGLAGLSEEDLKQPFAEGMNMVYKQLMAELEKLEVKPIEAVGREFNPDLHNAVMQVESEEYESGIIAQELQRGYTYRDSVVRHSMVAVVQ